MNKKVMTGLSTMALALSAAAADTFWQGGAGAWNSDNWSAGVPTASQNAIIKASGSDVTLEGDAGSAATLTVGYLLKTPVKLSIKTDLAVTSLRVANLTNKSEGEIEQTSGAVTVSSTGEAVIIGGGNSDRGERLSRQDLDGAARRGGPFPCAA